MGQYYQPTILGKNKKTVIAWMYSHDYGSGLKLMEHSWLKNPFVKLFESLIHNNPQRVVWAGDYADACKGRKSNVNHRCTDKNKITPSKENELSQQQTRFIINHTKKTYVDKAKVPDVNGWRIHPLPLLTCEGNGRGVGDYRDEDKNNLVGSWARDVISVSSKKPIGFTETLFDLKED